MQNSHKTVPLVVDNPGNSHLNWIKSTWTWTGSFDSHQDNRIGEHLFDKSTPIFLKFKKSC